jgi:hypothetical protein
MGIMVSKENFSGNSIFISPFQCFGIKLNETSKWDGLFVHKEIHSLDFVTESRKKYFKPEFCKGSLINR